MYSNPSDLLKSWINNAHMHNDLRAFKGFCVLENGQRYEFHFKTFFWKDLIIELSGLKAIDISLRRNVILQFEFNSINSFVTASGMILSHNIEGEFHFIPYNFYFRENKEIFWTISQETLCWNQVEFCSIPNKSSTVDNDTTALSV
ncbi:MAG: hypothetical protein ACOX5R_22450 [bacterium]